MCGWGGGGWLIDFFWLSCFFLSHVPELCNIVLTNQWLPVTESEIHYMSVELRPNLICSRGRRKEPRECSFSKKARV